MAIVTAKRSGPVRPKHATDPYSTHLRERAPVQIDPSMYPVGGSLGDAGDTGIQLVDDVHHQINDAAAAAKVTAAFAIAAGVFSGISLWLLVGKRRR
jgi:hypothetical protein